MSRWRLPGPVLLMFLALTGCGDETATGIGDDLFPIEPRTLEITLPWSEFAREVQVFGGFGRVSELPTVHLARAYQGVLDARVLARFADYPATIQARDTADDMVKADSLYSFAGGRLIARFDTAGRTETLDFEVRRPPAGWDAVSATWRAAVDTFGVVVPWEEPGAGPAPRLAGGSWDPEEADSLVIELDSATVDALSDTTSQRAGLRLDVTTEGTLLTLQELDVEVDVVPSFNPDTVVTFQSAARTVTFVYDPVPEAPGNEIRIGGVPAWRTAIRFSLPDLLDGPPALCEQVGCPFALDASRLSAASLTLTSRAPAMGFRPGDSLRVDVRPVLAPDRLPKSPLGSSLTPSFGIGVGPELFDGRAGEPVTVPVTPFVQNLVRGETSSGDDPPEVLALLSAGEPLTLALGSFVGPGEPGEPVLRMVLTTSDTVQIR